MRIVIILIWSILLVGCSQVDPIKELNRQIAFTFDDGPRPSGPIFEGEDRTEALIRSLAKADVKSVWFFVTTNNIARENNNGDARLKRYVEAGHQLANHSHSHLWFNKTDTDAYIADMDKARDLLANYGETQPYYRYPYLDEGRSFEKRDAMVTTLADRGMFNGYVSVDTYDWYMDALFGEALKAGHDVNMDVLRDTYVNSLVQSVEFYDDISQDVLGRSPKHVLLLHENDLAAMFINDLAQALRDKGWEIISPEEAYRDDIAKYVPKTLFLGQGRISAIADDKGMAREALVHERENEAFLRAEFIAKGLLPKPMVEPTAETP